MHNKQNNLMGFSGKLNYAHLIDDGVIINKDGAFLVSFKYQGPDIESATKEENDALKENFNRMMTFLNDGWMVHVDEIRVPSIDYPHESYFPDSVSALIDDERKQLYETEGLHFENLQFLTFVWKFPAPLVKTAKHWFVSGLEKNESEENLTTLYQHFANNVERCVQFLSSQLQLKKLSSQDLLTFLNTCLSGDLSPISLPPRGCYIDVALSRKPVIGGFYPKIGDKYIRIISITDYLNDETVCGLLEEITTYPLIYRWSNRFIPLSEATAEKEIKEYEKNWNKKAKGLMGIIKDAFTGQESKPNNDEALIMSAQTRDALILNSSNNTRFGYWTSELVILHEELSILDKASQEIQKYLEQRGFASIKETANAMDAWLGTIPGHGSCNARKLFVTSNTLAHALPLQTIWAGGTQNDQESLLPPQAPPIFYGATIGATPFRYFADYQDVGHTLIVGPTGSGKTTLLQLMIAQFLRYKNARVRIFDKDYSHLGITESLNGRHYDLGQGEELAFAPLADLSTDNKIMRATDYINTLIELQGVTVNPAIRTDVYHAIKSLANQSYQAGRNLTVFQSEVQNEEVRNALECYTLNGPLKILDSIEDSFQQGEFLQTFETGQLVSQRSENYIPILKYVLDKVELELDEANGAYPTLIILEEAWRYILISYFGSRINDWLLTMRKKNARIIFTTPTLSALYDPANKNLNTTSAIIMESCFKKFYLPNKNMEEETKQIYLKMGLNERQIDIITKHANPKQHYYLVTPKGKRLIELGFDQVNPLALNFIGLSKEESLLLKAFKKKHGPVWVYYWLTERGFSEWAHYWNNNYNSQQAAI